MIEIPFKNPLVIGTGGGNDIVSALMVTQHLGAKALAGMLSPGATHFFNGIREQPINNLVRNTRRFIMSKKPKEIPFIDPLILGLPITPRYVFSLSLQHGPRALRTELTELIKQHEFDGIVLVDVGGDILGSMVDSDTLLSPLVDHTILLISQHLPAPAILIEFGLQTDGELSLPRCRTIMDSLKTTRRAILGEGNILDWAKEYNYMSTLYRNRIAPVREGHTVKMLDKTLTSEANFVEEYRARRLIFDREFRWTFNVSFSTEFFGKMWAIDSDRLASLVPPHIDIVDTYHYLKSYRIKNELDGCYLERNGRVTWFANFIGYPECTEMYEYGMKHLGEHADEVIGM